MDDTVIINELKELVRIYGTQREAARHIINPIKNKPMAESYLSMLINGEQAVPEWLATVFHYRAEWIYYPVMKGEK